MLINGLMFDYRIYGQFERKVHIIIDYNKPVGVGQGCLDKEGIILEPRGKQMNAEAFMEIPKYY